MTRAGIALTGVGGATIAATEAAAALTGKPLTAESIGQAAELAARRPGRVPITGAAPSTSGTWCATFVERILGRPTGAHGDMAERAA